MRPVIARPLVVTVGCKPYSIVDRLDFLSSLVFGSCSQLTDDVFVCHCFVDVGRCFCVFVVLV